MGQCTWIVEKFWDWTDCAGPPENVISPGPAAGQRDAVLAEQHRRLLGPAVLGELRQAPDGPGRGADRGARCSRASCGGCRGPGSSSATPTCGTGASRAPAATSPAWNSPRSTSTSCAPSSARCATSLSIDGSAEDQDRGREPVNEVLPADRAQLAHCAKTRRARHVAHLGADGAGVVVRSRGTTGTCRGRCR